jgi:hypothetical protein
MANPVLDFVPFGHWTLRDKFAQAPQHHVASGAQVGQNRPSTAAIPFAY